VIYLVYVIGPLLRLMGRLDHSAEQETVKRKHIQQLIAQEPQLRQEFDELSKTMERLRASMPAEQELALVIEQLSGMANQAGVKIQTIFPQRSLESFKVVAGLDARSQTRLYKEIPIQIDALAGYHQLGRFLARVERGRQPVQLKSLRLTTNPKEPRRHVAELVLIAYFATAGDAKSSEMVVKP
jgi:Tfp pilus assembly protein PilO